MYSLNANNPADVIKSIRKKRKLSATKVSLEAGYSPTVVQNWEQKKCIPKFDIYVDMLHTLGYNIVLQLSGINVPYCKSNLTNVLHAERLKRSMTQKETAKRLNISEVHYYNLERGYSPVTTIGLINLAKLFDFKIKVVKIENARKTLYEQ